MSICNLTIRDFRNISSADLVFSPSLNLIYGENGSGKTSLLEAIYYLSTAQSFRTQNIEPLIRKSCTNFTIAASIQFSGEKKRIGLRRSRQKILRRINQETVHRQIELTQLLPVRVLHPDSHKLVSGAPAYRRSFLDWGCFYFNASFFKTWSTVKTLLKQRNALLKTQFNPKVLKALDQQFIGNSELLDEIRQQYLQELRPYINTYCEKILGQGFRIELDYHPGWINNLSDQLNNDHEKDRRFKRTHSGPHRADLLISLNEAEARNNASRGQQKLLVVILTLSQIHHYQSHTQRPGLLMIDDLPSELDKTHQNLFINALQDLNQQIIITAIDPENMGLTNWKELRMFHVKHGEFSEVV